MSKEGIVAFAFGVPHNIPSNEYIGKIASRDAYELEAPIFTQLEVAINMPHLWQVAKKVELVANCSNSICSISTLTMARGAVEWAMRNGVNRLWIVAALPHFRRCRRDLIYAVREAGVKIEIAFYHYNLSYFQKFAWFSSKSEQARTRSKLLWVIREKILMSLPMFLYTRIAI